MFLLPYFEKFIGKSNGRKGVGSRIQIGQPSKIFGRTNHGSRAKESGCIFGPQGLACQRGALAFNASKQRDGVGFHQ